MAFEIVKHIISVKIKEKEDLQDKLVKQERKAAILKVLSTKKDEELQEKSIEELVKELESLA